MTEHADHADGPSARTVAKPVRAREDPDVQACLRCHDPIPGGLDGWAAHEAGADTADQAGKDGYAAALAEHRRRSDATTSSSYVERAARAKF